MPPFEYWMYRIGWAAGIGLTTWFMLEILPPELRLWFKDYRIWKAKRAAKRTGQLEEVEQKCPK